LIIEKANTMLNVKLNGEDKVVEGCSLLENAIAEWALSNQTFAIALNEQFIPKSLYASTQLQEGDRLEFLVPMQGG